MTKCKLTYLLSFIVLIAISSSCKKNDVLSRDKMVEVLRDIQLAEAVASTQYNDFKLKEQKEALTRGVLQKHNITQAQLDSSLVWYSDNVEIYNRVNDSVIASLRREHDLLTKRIPRDARPRRVVNFNILPEFYYLNDANPILTFNIDSFQINKYPDLRFALRTLWTQNSVDAEMSVSFQYKDTIIYEALKLNKDKLYVINKPNIKDSLKVVSGYFYLSPKEEYLNQHILLYNIAVRDSIKVEKDSSSIEKNLIKIEKDSIEVKEDSTKVEKDSVIVGSDSIKIERDSIKPETPQAPETTTNTTDSIKEE